MTAFHLLIDFGASNVKASLMHPDTGDLSELFVRPALSNAAAQQGYYEIAPASIHGQFVEICKHYTDMGFTIAGIWLCSQMHGFMLVDSRDQPLTNYISWRDERAAENIDALSTLDYVDKHLSSQYKVITGMRARAGLPFLSLLHIARDGSYPASTAKLISLPEWITLCGQQAFPVVHDTMLAGSGCYDLQKKQVSADLVDMINAISRQRLVFNEVCETGSVAAYIHLNGDNVPLYAGVGDHQCALLGAGNTEHTISINLGTGSQVSRIDRQFLSSDFEARPYFDASYLTTQTHIPAGRALNEYIGWLHSICQMMTGSSGDAWQYIAQLTVDEVLNAPFDIDLAVFEAAFNYREGGSISGIREGRLTAKNYLSSLINSFVRQYLPILDKINTECRQAYVLSGGIPRKLPIIRDLLACYLKTQLLASPSIDETLLGLRCQALSVSHGMRYSDCNTMFPMARPIAC